MNIRSIAVPFGAAIIVAQFALTIAACSGGCSPALTGPATFAGEMEDCFQNSNSCAEYVQCTHAAQRSKGLPESGSCDLNPTEVDAGENDQ